MAATARVRVCFAVKFDALIPYIKETYILLRELRYIYIDLNKDKVVKT